MPRRHYTADFKARRRPARHRAGLRQPGGRQEPGGAPQHHAALGPPPDDPAALKAELGRLREEVRRLTMGREILEKATAFFAGERARGSPSSATTGASPRWR
jgi:transposase-like protein